MTGHAPTIDPTDLEQPSATPARPVLKDRRLLVVLLVAGDAGRPAYRWPAPTETDT